MRVRAGIVLLKEDRVALIERYRAGFHYFIFPGGGVDAGESLEQAAVREAKEELGIDVAIKQKVAELQLGQQSQQFYFLVEQTGGEFGSGTGEEFLEENHNNPHKGIYIPIWMPISELLQHTNVYPADVARLVVQSMEIGWLQEPTLIVEKSK
ncbi:MAG TPA: NUDIX domain-containing protein [Anaerolineales bacterium]|nr:NUDIX domain-containing protein [Anaerolineales bacterium]